MKQDKIAYTSVYIDGEAALMVPWVWILVKQWVEKGGKYPIVCRESIPEIEEASEAES